MTPIGTRTTLLIAGSSTVLLAVVLLTAGAPAWSWATIFVLAGITGAGAVAAPQEGR